MTGTDIRLPNAGTCSEKPIHLSTSPGPSGHCLADGSSAQRHWRLRGPAESTYYLERSTDSITATQESLRDIT